MKWTQKIVKKIYEYKEPDSYNTLDDWVIPIMMLFGIGLFIWAIVVPYWGYLWR
jgi:hypothetical protein